jgi:hypothetical protein
MIDFDDSTDTAIRSRATRRSRGSWFRAIPVTCAEGPLSTTNEGAPMGVGLHALIGTHAVAIANSGVGKSGLLRKLLETTNGRVQQLVLDPEDKL